MNNALDNMAQIQAIFITSKKKAMNSHDLESLNEYLLQTPSNFTSIAFEAAAMGVAIQGLKKDNSTANWKTFYTTYGQNHAAQVHVGLGWALAELDQQPDSFIADLNPFLKYRVLDGYGYYFGKFKRRQAVRLQEIPADLDANSTRAFNQGLGRSFWYNAQGDPEKLMRMLHLFAPERIGDMWRGIGIAANYVGGSESSVIENLVHQAEDYAAEFKCGLALVIQSRLEANTLSEEISATCRTILNKSSDEVNTLLNELKKATNSNEKSAYFEWINSIEQHL